MDYKENRDMAEQIQGDVQTASNAAKDAKNIYKGAKNAANTMKGAKNAANTMKAAKNAAQAASAAKDVAKGAAQAASGNYVGAAISLLKSSPQLIKVVALVLGFILIVQTTLPSLIWGNITDYSNASDKSGIELPDDVAGSGEALTDELLDEVLLCSRKTRKRAEEIASSIRAEKSSIDSACKGIFESMDDVEKSGVAYDPNVSGNRKISSVTKVKWGGTELNIDTESAMTFYQASKIIAAYNVATDGYVDEPDHDKPYTVSGTKDNQDDQVGSLADWLGSPATIVVDKYIAFNIGGSGGVPCRVSAWKGSFLPQYLVEQRKQDIESGKYDEDYYSSKSCALLDMLMLVSGPASLDEAISVDVVKELKDASYTETTTSYVEKKVKKYYRRQGIYKNGKFQGIKEVEVTDPAEIAAMKYTHFRIVTVKEPVTSTRTVNYQYWEYTYSGSAKVNVSIGVKDFGSIANSLGLWAGSFEQAPTTN